MCKHRYFLLGMSCLILLLPRFAAAQTVKKTAYLILLDNSGSMKSQFSQVQTLAKGLVQRLSRLGPVSIVTFQTQGDIAIVEAPIDWTQDEDKLIKFIGGVSTITGRTALIDGVASAAEVLVAKAASLGAEKVLVLVTDGDDRIPRATGMIISPTDEDDRWRKARDQLAKKLKEESIKTYAIGLTGELDAGSLARMSRRQKAESLLTKVAKQTGGQAVFSNSKNIDPEKMLNDLLRR